jgi:hypothetical protein
VQWDFSDYIAYAARPGVPCLEGVTRRFYLGNGKVQTCFVCKLSLVSCVVKSIYNLVVQAPRGCKLYCRCAQLTACISPEHFLGVDGDERPATPGQYFPFFIGYFSHIDVLTPVHANALSFDAKRLMERHRLEIFHRHFFRERNHLVKLVHLAHRVIENGSDNAAVAVPRRTGVALAEAEAADEGLAFFVEREFQTHAIGIVLPAGEAVVLLHLGVFGVVAVNLAGTLAGHAVHAPILSRTEAPPKTPASQEVANAVYISVSSSTISHRS